MVAVRSIEALVVAFTALALFAACSFWVVRVAHRINAVLETRHPDLLKKIPHAQSQGPVAVAFAFLPIAYGLDDETLSNDVARLKIVAVLSGLTWAIMAVSFFLALGR